MAEHYKVGDSVKFEYGFASPGDALEGTVSAVETYESEVGTNQKLTIDWVALHPKGGHVTDNPYGPVVVAQTIEYAQDVRRA